MNQFNVQDLFFDNEDWLASVYDNLRKQMTKPTKQDYMRGILEQNLNEITRHMEDKIDHPKLKLYFMQFITNFITANELNQRLILEKFQSDKILKQIQESKDQTLVKCIFIFTFNMCQQGEIAEKLLFQSNFSDMIRLQIIEFFTKKEPQDEDLEWVSFLFGRIFIYPFKESYLQYLCKDVDQDTLEQIFIFIYLFMTKTTDQRIYPTVLQGYSPKIFDIQVLYDNSTTKIGFQFQLLDLHYLFSMIDEKKLQMIIFSMFSVVTFMGGFNYEVQKLFFPDIFIKSLDILTQLTPKETEKDQIEQNELITPILRFLSNMTHINKDVWEYLTQNSQQLQHILKFRQANLYQHREWTTVMIKNLCDCQQLREQMQ